MVPDEYKDREHGADTDYCIYGCRFNSCPMVLFSSSFEASSVNFRIYNLLGNHIQIHDILHGTFGECGSKTTA